MDYVLLFLIISFGFMVGTATGFGGTIISLTFAVLLFPMQFVVPIVVPLNVVLCIYMTGRHRGEVDLQALFKRILPFALLGIPPGIWVFTNAEAAWMRPAFGIFVFFLAIFELARIHRDKNRLSPPDDTANASPVWLLAGGFIQGLWVSGGPLIAYWAVKALPSKGVFRSTLLAVWLVLNCFLLAGHLVVGRITGETALMSLQLFPALIVGILLGEPLHNRLPERSFRFLVYAVLLFAGAAILVKG